jgi:hypothetical protein
MTVEMAHLHPHPPRPHPPRSRMYTGASDLATQPGTVCVVFRLRWCQLVEGGFYDHAQRCLS